MLVNGTRCLQRTEWLLQKQIPPQARKFYEELNKAAQTQIEQARERGAMVPIEDLFPENSRRERSQVGGKRPMNRGGSRERVGNNELANGWATVRTSQRRVGDQATTQQQRRRQVASVPPPQRSSESNQRPSAPEARSGEGESHQ